MKKRSILPIVVAVAFLFSPGNRSVAGGKKEKKRGYEITDLYKIPTTSVKNQQSTGTCWSFATTSFIETELMRMGKPEYDISEMFFVSRAYEDKANRYVRFQGNSNFGQGGQAHDVMNVIKDYGMVPEAVYDGKNYGSEVHAHGEMVAVLQGMLEGVVKNRNRKLTPVWDHAFKNVVETYLGTYPEKFEWEDIAYGPGTFLNETGFNPDDYIEFTSYSHHPFFESFILEVPDNWSHDPYINVPIDDLMSIMNNAFKNGFSVDWDGDVSESTFSHKDGLAILPLKPWIEKTDEEKENTFKVPEVEMAVTQSDRQETFDNYTSTDDHLMHLVGLARDKSGNMYYQTKNSWGRESNKQGGYLYMSEAYVRMKTIAIMVHKDAVPEDIMNKIKW